VHEKGIEIDPKKIEAIWNVKAPTCHGQGKLLEEVHL
jgi:hypothetical protein